MPEGPEAYVIAAGLNAKFAGADVEHREIILAVRSWGKKVIITDSRWHHVVSLGMTGTLLTTPGKCTRHRWNTSRGVIYFDDPRNLGNVQVVDRALFKGTCPKGVLDRDYVLTPKYTRNMVAITTASGKIGRCWMNDRPTRAEFATMVRSVSARRKMCPFLMFQDLFCGVGNYIKSDSMYMAKIDPVANVNSLTTTQIRALYKAISSIMDLSVRNGGHTFKDFRKADGTKGGYIPLVYGQTLTKTGEEVVRVKTTDGRATWWVVI